MPAKDITFSCQSSFIGKYKLQVPPDAGLLSQLLIQAATGVVVVEKPIAVEFERKEDSTLPKSMII